MQVDAQALGLHDSHQVVRRPMDLGTIKKNLMAETAPYSSSAEVLKDVQQVWGNCRQYNDEDDPIMYVSDLAGGGGRGGGVWPVTVHGQGLLQQGRHVGTCVRVMHDKRNVHVKTAYSPEKDHHWWCLCTLAGHPDEHAVRSQSTCSSSMWVALLHRLAEVHSSAQHDVAQHLLQGAVAAA